MPHQPNPNLHRGRQACTAFYTGDTICTMQGTFAPYPRVSPRQPGLGPQGPGMAVSNSWPFPGESNLREGNVKYFAIQTDSYSLTSMQVCRQHKRMCLQPAHDSYCFRLWRVSHLEELIWEVSIQIIVVAVVSANCP